MTPDEFHTALHVDLGKPQVEVRTRTVGKFTYKEVVKEPGAHRASWALASVTLPAHSIKVQINLNLKQNDLSAADYFHTGIPIGGRDRSDALLRRQEGLRQPHAVDGELTC